MIKKGDTLIEVTIAVGIFSMVAIAIVSVMTASTSNAQTALETTLAREEIDAQAEALRFIHAAYTNTKDDPNNKYTKLWQKIKAATNDLKNEEPTVIAKYVQYNTPKSCANVLDYSTLQNQNAFILNVNKLDDFTDTSIESVFISSTNASIRNRFAEATTYPRILYGSVNDEQILIADNIGQDLVRAEGIFIVGVKDPKNTIIVAKDGVANKVAYYDFYIRTCWYGADANTPTIISTLIRLSDPDVGTE